MIHTHTHTHTVSKKLPWTLNHMACYLHMMQLRQTFWEPLHFLESSLNLDFAKIQSTFQYFNSVLLVNHLSVLLILVFLPSSV